MEALPKAFLWEAPGAGRTVLEFSPLVARYFAGLEFWGGVRTPSIAILKRQLKRFERHEHYSEQSEKSTGTKGNAQVAVLPLSRRAQVISAIGLTMIYMPWSSKFRMDAIVKQGVGDAPATVFFLHKVI